MGKFIYVFSIADRDSLLSQGYSLLKSDDRNEIYVFENNQTLCFDMTDIPFTFSNTLTF